MTFNLATWPFYGVTVYTCTFHITLLHVIIERKDHKNSVFQFYMQIVCMIVLTVCLRDGIILVFFSGLFVVFSCSARRRWTPC